MTPTHVVSAAANGSFVNTTNGVPSGGKITLELQVTDDAGRLTLTGDPACTGADALEPEGVKSINCDVKVIRVVGPNGSMWEQGFVVSGTFTTLEGLTGSINVGLFKVTGAYRVAYQTLAPAFGGTGPLTGPVPFSGAASMQLA